MLNKIQKPCKSICLLFKVCNYTYRKILEEKFSNPKHLLGWSSEIIAYLYIIYMFK